MLKDLFENSFFLEIAKNLLTSQNCLAQGEPTQRPQERNIKGQGTSHNETSPPCHTNNKNHAKVGLTTPKPHQKRKGEENAKKNYLRKQYPGSQHHS
jgi:hypothetical protein